MSRSERVNQVTPLPESFLLAPPSGDRFLSNDVLSIPSLAYTYRPPAPSQPSYSVLMSNPLAPSILSHGSRMLVLDHKQCALKANSEGLEPVHIQKPKNSLKNNNSALISRTLITDQLSKRMKDSDLSSALVVVTSGRQITLLDEGTQSTAQRTEPLAKLTFTKAWPLCMAFNSFTSSASQLDVVFGLSSGDLLWMDLVSMRYQRVNKQGNVTRSAVTAITWVPNSSSLVMAAHQDGTVCLYDVYADDGPQISSQPRSLGSADPKSCVKAIYRLGNGPVMQLLFATPTKLVAAGEWDYLTVFEMETEQITDYLPTFFGGVRALDISYDGRYLAAAGEDDMINVFDLAKGLELAARFQGHKSCIKAISFDKYNSDQQLGVYRVASVAEDQQVVLWDFIPSTLIGPKLPPNADISPDFTWASNAHKLEGSSALVHGRVPQFAAKTVAPTVKVYVRLPQFKDTDISDVKFTQNGLLVVSEGKLWSWKRKRMGESAQ